MLSSVHGIPDRLFFQHNLSFVVRQIVLPADGLPHITFTFYVVQVSIYMEESYSDLAPPTLATCGMLSRMRPVPTNKKARLVQVM